MAHKAQLIISQPGHRTRRVDLAEDGVTSIGRSSDNTVCLKHDENVSRYHSEITSREDGYWLSDLTTRNGTTVNDTPVESEHKLVNGDLICLGGASTIEFSFPESHESDAANPPTPEKDALSVEDASSAPAPEPRPERKSTATVLGIIGGLAVTAIFIGALFATGLVHGGGGKKSRQVASTSKDPQQSSSPLSDENEATPTPIPQPDPTEEAVADSTPITTDPPGAPNANAQVLAAKISPKNYRFDPALIALVGGYVNEYKSASGYYGRARKYRDAIDKEFVNVQGLPPVFGYVIAMSRTKLLEEGGDVWGLPKAVTKIEAVDQSDINTGRIGGSTKTAASYIRGLWDVFGKEGFMYVVACYGMTLDEAGAVQQQLEVKDPNGQGRFDFWRMKNAGVVKGDQVERVARFFAAGIVMENPQQFGLSEPPLSTLY